MKKLLFILFLFLYAGAQGQKEDYVWLNGYRDVGNFAGYDTANQWIFGHSILDFNYTPFHKSYDSLHMNFATTNVSICDTSGHLMFYSNGVFVSNALDHPMQNGDSINAGYWMYVLDTFVHYFGYRTPHGMIAIPSPLSSDRYVLLHTFIDTLTSGGSLFCKNVLATEIDMSLVGGLGGVISKNTVLISSKLNFDVVSTRHGNGKDWWSIVQKRNTNCYYKILLTKNGVSLFDSSCLDIPLILNNISYSAFSPDGSKFAIVSYLDGIVLFDFDRCTGALSNSKFISLPILQDSGWTGLGLVFSPNNRFLYLSATKRLLQYDLWAADIANSADTVGKYDGYQSPFGSFFVYTQAAPDGKIYISCGNGENVYHVINRPDAKGDSCLFVQHGIQLPTFSVGVPNFPNYRLGALSGSACDTLTGLGENERAQKEKVIKVFPNPSSNFVMIDYGFTDWNKGEVSLEITNQLGQTVYVQTLPMYSGFQKLDISNYPSGVYNAFIMRGSSPNGGKGAVVAAAKFVRD